MQRYLVLAIPIAILAILATYVFPSGSIGLGALTTSSLISNPSFEISRSGSNLPAGWFYDAKFSDANFTSTDLSQWNLNQYYISNQALFQNLPEVIKDQCLGFIPSIKSHTFTLRPNTKYRLGFDVKAKLTSSALTLCGKPFDRDFVDVVVAPTSGADFAVFITNNSEMGSVGTDQLKAASDYESGGAPVNKQQLVYLGDGWYKFSGEFVTDDHTNAGELFVLDENAGFSDGSYALFKNFSLQEIG